MCIQHIYSTCVLNIFPHLVEPPLSGTPSHGNQVPNQTAQVGLYRREHEIGPQSGQIWWCRNWEWPLGLCFLHRVTGSCPLWAYSWSNNSVVALLCIVDTIIQVVSARTRAILYIQNGDWRHRPWLGPNGWSWTMMLVNDNIYIFSEGITVLFLFSISDKWRNA